MTVKVRIPSPLRSYTNGADSVETEGTSVGEVLNALKSKASGIETRLFKGPNQLNRKRAGLAMAMRSKTVHRAFDTIHIRHWHQLAMKNGGPAVWEAMVGLVERVGPALAAVEKRLPRNFHGRSWDAISKGMRAEAARFVSELASCKP